MSEPEESESQQLARNLNELLQEIRVAQAGVQILFGFLLSIAFTERYAGASGFVKGTHLITVLFATASVALLTSPAAWHRILFRLGHREQIIEMAGRFAVVGLACLAVAMTGTVLLLGEIVIGRWPAALVAAVAAVGFGVLWFALPIRQRVRNTE